MKNSSTQQLKECGGYTALHPAIMGGDSNYNHPTNAETVGVVGSDTDSERVTVSIET